VYSRYSPKVRIIRVDRPPVCSIAVAENATCRAVKKSLGRTRTRIPVRTRQCGRTRYFMLSQKSGFGGSFVPPLVYGTTPNAPDFELLGV
jgi:hypothetical protein